MLRQTASIFVLVFLLAGCGATPAEPPALPRVVTATAAEASVPDSLALTGTLAPSREATISAKAAGRITTLAAEVGTRVTAGALLARVDATTANTASAALQKNLTAAEKNLAAVRELYDQRLISARAALESTRKSGAAQIALVTTRLATTGTDTTADSSSTLTTVTITLEKIADALDNLLGLTDRNRANNDSFERYLGALDTNAKTTAEQKLREFLALEKNFRVKYDSQILPGGANKKTVDALLISAKENLQSARSALEATHTLLLKTVTAADYPDSTLTTQKNSVLALGGETEKLLAQIADLSGTVGASTAVVVTTSELAQTRALVAAQIEAAESQLRDLERERDTKILEATSRMTELAGQLSLAGVSVADTTVTAPFAGVVTAKLAEVGQVAAPGTPLLTLADDANFKVVIELPDTVAPAVPLGTPARIRVDGVEKVLTGLVTKLAPTAEATTKKRAVELELAGDQHLAAGQFARVEFDLPAIAGVVVPAQAVVSRYGENFVFMVSEGVVHRRVVTLGARTSEVVVIATGVAAGEVVAIKGHAWLREGEGVEVVE